MSYEDGAFLTFPTTKSLGSSVPLTSCGSSSQFVMEPSKTLVVPKSSNLFSVNDYFK